MTVKPDPTRLHSERQIEQTLLDHGSRFTRGRRAVVQALLAADGPLSAAEVRDTVDGPLSSVYRSLAVLEQAEVIRPHTGVRGVIRYEPAEWLRGHHHHLVCTSCGQVDDVRLPDTAERRLERLVTAAAPVGFVVDDHSLEIEGICEACR